MDAQNLRGTRNPPIEKLVRNITYDTTHLYRNQARLYLERLTSSRVLFTLLHSTLMRELMYCVKRLATGLVIAACLGLILAPAASAWGEEGHRYINRVAAEHLPEDMPAFFPKSSARLSFLGPEPDRWRDSRELFKALNEVNAPDHFVDIDKPENFEALPNDR